ncbi:MAG: CoA transferase, partial [Pseudomonadota bacterium]
FLMCMTQKFWQLLLEQTGHKELEEDPRFATMQARTAHRDELTPLLDEILRQEDTAFWIERLKGLVPAAPVYELPDALDNPFVGEIGMVQNVAHPADPNLRLLTNPIKLSGQRLPGEPGQGLGAGNASVLGDELGLSDRLADLRARGII